MTIERQQTLRDVVEFDGVGLHTGAEVRARIRPQPAGSGLAFRAGKAGPTIPALPEYVVETRFATVLGVGEARLSTVEHVLSALLGMNVDNALVEIDGPEMPILDGSSAPFVAAIAAVGIETQKAPRRRLEIAEPIVVREGEGLVVLLPSEGFRIRLAIDFPPPIGADAIDIAVEPHTYARAVAPARTFCALDDVEALRAAGLARGGSLENALVFAPDGPMTPLRLPNEAARHKALDLIGDFALLGAWPQVEVLAFRSGHSLNAKAVGALRRTIVGTAAVNS